MLFGVLIVESMNFELPELDKRGSKLNLLKITLSTCLLFIIAPFIVFSNAVDDVSPNLQMAIISDTHIGTLGSDALLRTVLDDYSKIAPNYDVLSIVGDLTTKGLISEYDLFNKVIREGTTNEIEKVFAIGNHEFFEKRYWPYPDLTDDEMVERFIDKTQDPELGGKVYYDKWVKDYHFIVLGSEGLHPENADIPVISNEQYDWLEETIREDAEEMKPIFVFLHQPIDDTIHCSEEWGARFESNRLKEILQQYPQTFLFSGHTHCLTEHPRTVYQDGFTMVGTGSVSKNRYYEAGIAPVQKSDGLLVNVYDDRVEINGRDFDAKQGSLSYNVNLPYNELEKITDDQAPIFSEDSTFTVNMLNRTTAELTWDAALDNTQVDKYIIKQNGEVLKTIWVDFWNEDSSHRQYQTEMTNLVFNEDYSFEIIAIDAWGNESTAIQTQLLGIKNTGWVDINSTWYYINPETNDFTTRWLFINNEWYYFNIDGSMKTGWLSEGPVSYYLNDDGKIAKGWLYKNNHWYHFSASTGVMTTGWLVEKSKRYYLNTDGSMAKGWLEIRDKRYFMGSSGLMTTGWLLQNGKWYYLDTDGTMKTGWATIGSTKYYLDTNGAMATGWIDVDDSWHYMKSSGAMTTGWLLKNGNWYYLEVNGVMSQGWTKINRDWYYMKSSGAMTIGWQLDSGNWYYLKQNGSMQTGWLKIGPKWYYLASGGQMQTGWIEILGTWYYLDSNGAWIDGF